jgi:hypothetical protein
MFPLLVSGFQAAASPRLITKGSNYSNKPYLRR